jgi:lipopolysaccharide export system protein LptA
MERRRLQRALGAWGLLAFAGLAAHAAAASPPSLRLAGKFYTVETNAAHYNFGSGAFSTQASVHITREGLDAFADRADGNTKSGTAVMRGNVRVHDRGGQASPQGRGAEAATLTCDELDVDAKTDVYRAVGHAHYESATRTAAADTMVMDRKHRTLHLDGDVTLTDGDTTVRASVVDADMAHHDAVATGAPVVITRPVESPSPVPGTLATPGSVRSTTPPRP